MATNKILLGVLTLSFSVPFYCSAGDDKYQYYFDQKETVIGNAQEDAAALEAGLGALATGGCFLTMVLFPGSTPITVPCALLGLGAMAVDSPLRLLSRSDKGDTNGDGVFAGIGDLGRMAGESVYEGLVSIKEQFAPAPGKRIIVKGFRAR